MSAPRETRTSSVHAPIGVLITLAVGLTFAFRSLLSFAGPNFWSATSVLDYVAVASWSVALGMLAPGALLVAQIASGRRSVTAAAIVLALGGLVAAVANLIEDGLGLKAFGVIYEFGLAGILGGLIWLAIALALARRWSLAALSVATFAGLFSSEFGGGLLILFGWSILAIVLWRSRRPLGDA